VVQPRNPYVKEAVEEFLCTKAAREQATRASYSSILVGAEFGTRKPLGRPFAAYFRNRKFDSLSQAEVAAWFGQRVDGGAQNTKHRISKAARHFLGWAAQRGYASGDLVSAVEPFQQGRGRIDWLGWEEIDRVLAAIPEFRLRFAAAWLFCSGCRVGEAIAGVQADVRWRDEFALYEWTIPHAKTHRARMVWLPQRLGEFLERARERNRPQPCWPILWDCTGRGFARIEHPAAPITQRTINSALKAARERAGLTTPVTPHVCKHSFCTNWINEHGQGELAMEKLARLVGTSSTVLRRTYVHLSFTPDDWDDLRSFGSPKGRARALAGPPDRRLPGAAVTEPRGTVAR